MRLQDGVLSVNGTDIGDEASKYDLPIYFNRGVAMLIVPKALGEQLGFTPETLDRLRLAPLLPGSAASAFLRPDVIWELLRNTYSGITALEIQLESSLPWKDNEFLISRRVRSSHELNQAQR